MDGVGGTIKNLVFRAVKSGKISVRDPEEFVKAANDIVPSIRSIYMPIVDMLEEPLEVANAPAIPETLQVHKIVREITKENIPFTKFFKLSRDDSLHTLSTIDRRKVLKFAATQIDMSTITRVLTVSPITKSVTRRKR